MQYCDRFVGTSCPFPCVLFVFVCVSCVFRHIDWSRNTLVIFPQSQLPILFKAKRILIYSHVKIFFPSRILLVHFPAPSTSLSVPAPTQCNEISTVCINELKGTAAAGIKLKASVMKGSN